MHRLALACLVLGAACSAQTTSPDPQPQRPSTTVVGPTTGRVDPSTALVLIGPARYELTANCATAGPGELEVSVAGVDVNGLPVVGYIRAFLAEPYVSLQVGTGDDAVLFEPRLEGTLPFEFTETGVEFPEVEFVTELDLETGEFVPAGVGSVEVVCRAYERELPPVPFG